MRQTDEQKWIIYIKEHCYSRDAENNHFEADEALTSFLIHLGYSKLAKEWERVIKWYA